jgi:hypothetical protein
MKKIRLVKDLQWLDIKIIDKILFDIIQIKEA